MIAVYCYYDVEGRPLYVGQSGNLRQRDRTHARTASWYAEVASMAILVRCSTRENARFRECQQIVSLRPAHNIQHSHGSFIEYGPYQIRPFLWEDGSPMSARARARESLRLLRLKRRVA